MHETETEIESESIFATIRAFKSNSKTSIAPSIFTNSKFPEYLIPIGYDHLVNQKCNIPIYILDECLPKRRKYVVFLLIKQNEKIVFQTDKYINEIFEYFTKMDFLEKEFLTENIVKYTRLYLTKDNEHIFMEIWELFKDNLFCNLFKELIDNLNVTSFLKRFILKILKTKETETIIRNFNRFFIANDIFYPELIKDPIFQIRNVVKLLITNDIEEKKKLCDYPFYFCFKKILEINLCIFDINLKFLKLFSDKDFIIQEFETFSIENNIFKTYQKIEKSNYDDILTREILLFFSSKRIVGNWCYYFIPKITVKSYDDYFINKNLFDIKNYNIAFSKNELHFIEKDVLTENNLIDLYILSQKNPIFKNNLKASLEKNVLKDSSSYQRITDFLNCKLETIGSEKTDNKYLYNKICIDNEDEMNYLRKFLENIEPKYSLSSQEDKNYLFKSPEYYILRSLKLIGSNHFTSLLMNYREKFLDYFLSVLNEYLQEKNLCYDLFEEIIKKEYERITNTMNDLKIKNFYFLIIQALLLKLKSYGNKCDIKFFMERLELCSPLILEKFSYDVFIDSFTDIKEALVFLDSKRQKSNALGLNIKPEDKNYLKGKLLFNIKSNNMRLFDDDYVIYTSNIINFYIKTRNPMRRIVLQQKNQLEKEKVISDDKFIKSLLFDNKDVNVLINTFYSPKDMQTKMYMPRFWKIYFQRNKINDISVFLNQKFKPVNTLHVINILTAIYNDSNSIVIFKFLETIKNTQDSVFYKLLFILYNYKSNKKEFKEIFAVICSLSTKTIQNDIIISILSQIYGLKGNFKLNEKGVLLASNITRKDGSAGDEIAKIFVSGDIEGENEEINIFKATRIMDVEKKTDLEDKSGIFDFLYSKLEQEPTIYIKILTNLDKIETRNIACLEEIIKKDSCIEEIINLLSKHRNIINYNKIYESLKNYDQFYKNEFLVNLLEKHEIKRLVEDKNFCNISFFENVTDFELLNIIEKNTEENNTYYKKNHFEILKVISYKTKIITVNEIDSVHYYRDLIYILLVKLNSNNEYIEIFIENVKNISILIKKYTFDAKCCYDIEFDWSLLCKENIVNQISIEVIVNENLVAKNILTKILGGEKYYFPIYIEKFKKSKMIQYLK